MPGEGRVLLTNGLWRDGVCHDEAILRPLTGADEMLLAEAAAVPAIQATVLLAATVQALGSVVPVTDENIRRLTIGDRERLQLALYRLSFGARVDTVLCCPDCREAVELPLDLDVVLSAFAAPPRAQEHSILVGTSTLRFRLPNGADHERAARIAATDPEAAAAALSTACVIALTDGSGNEIAAGRLPDQVREALEDSLRRLDPDAETIIAADCPGCGARVSGMLDAASLLAGELGPAGGILGDVDRIARAYHWSEASILALPSARRRSYLALLDRAEATA